MRPCSTWAAAWTAGVFRIDPPANVQWFDVDYPDVIDLRRQLFPERGASYHLIGAPLDDLRWLV